MNERDPAEIIRRLTALVQRSQSRIQRLKQRRPAIGRRPDVFVGVVPFLGRRFPRKGRVSPSDLKD